MKKKMLQLFKSKALTILSCSAFAVAIVSVGLASGAGVYQEKEPKALRDLAQ